MPDTPPGGQDEARQRLVEAARLTAVARVVPTVAHQLSTPLAAIALRAESLERTVQDLGEHQAAAKLRRHLQSIQEETFRCKELLGTLQDFARTPGPRAPVDLNVLVNGAVRLVRHEAMRRQAEIELRLPDLLPTVPGDEVRLGQAVLCLVHNAVLASPSGGRVTVETAAEKDAVSLAVADEGEGIPADVQPRLFEPFVSSRPVEAGVGIGLMACRLVATAHGGTVGWETTPGRGSRFTLVLPRTAPSSPTEPPR